MMPATPAIPLLLGPGDARPVAMVGRCIRPHGFCIPAESGTHLQAARAYTTIRNVAIAEGAGTGSSDGQDLSFRQACWTVFPRRPHGPPDSHILVRCHRCTVIALPQGCSEYSSPVQAIQDIYEHEDANTWQSFQRSHCQLIHVSALSGTTAGRYRATGCLLYSPV